VIFPICAKAHRKRSVCKTRCVVRRVTVNDQECETGHKSGTSKFNINNLGLSKGTIKSCN